MSWYCEIEGEKVGPLTDSELKRLADSGGIKRESRVRDAFDPKWKLAQDVPDLFPSEDLPTSADDGGPTAGVHGKTRPAKYLCRIAGEIVGPLTGHQLKKLANSGNLKPTDTISKVDRDEWVTASRYKDLFVTKGKPTEERPRKKQTPRWSPIESQISERVRFLYGAVVTSLVAAVLFIVLKWIVGISVSYFHFIGAMFALIVVGAIIPGSRELAIRRKDGGWAFAMTMYWLGIPVHRKHCFLDPSAKLKVLLLDASKNGAVTFGLVLVGISDYKIENMALGAEHDPAKIQAQARKYADGLKMRCDMLELEARQRLLSADDQSTFQCADRSLHVKTIDGASYLLLRPRHQTWDERLYGFHVDMFVWIIDLNEYQSCRLVSDQKRLILEMNGDADSPQRFAFGKPEDLEDVTAFLKRELGGAIQVHSSSLGSAAKLRELNSATKREVAKKELNEAEQLDALDGLNEDMRLRYGDSWTRPFVVDAKLTPLAFIGGGIRGFGFSRNEMNYVLSITGHEPILRWRSIWITESKGFKFWCIFAVVAGMSMFGWMLMANSIQNEFSNTPGFPIAATTFIVTILLSIWGPMAAVYIRAIGTANLRSGILGRNQGQGFFLLNHVTDFDSPMTSDQRLAFIKKARWKLIFPAYLFLWLVPLWVGAFLGIILGVVF